VFHGIDEQNEMHLGRRDLIIVVEVVIQSSQHLNKPHDIMRMTHLPEISAKSWYQNIPVSDTSDTQFGTKFFWYQFPVQRTEYKNGKDLLYHHGGDRGSHAGYRRSMMFFLFVSNGNY